MLEDSQHTDLRSALHNCYKIKVRIATLSATPCAVSWRVRWVALATLSACLMDRSSKTGSTLGAHYLR